MITHRWLAGLCRSLAAASLACGLPCAALAQAAAGDPQLELGRRIYTEGRLAPGVDLVATRTNGTTLQGAAAACANCHRPSGMGQVEANMTVPPITGKYLFGARNDNLVATMDPHVSKQFNQAHDPYTSETLRAAIRRGVNVQGQEMGVLMPRYALDDTQLAAVEAYLRQLSVQWSPGVSQTLIRFATVITPEVGAERRSAFISMMRTIVRQKNGSTVTAVQNKTRHHMISAAEMVMGTERQWALDVWELQGPPETWREQLAAFYRKQPVFALLSGLSDTSWQPVQDFCDQEHVPGWFPSVNLPGQDGPGQVLHFSGGVRLESSVLAQRLREHKPSGGRVVQVYRDDAVGQAAAQSLAGALQGSRLEVLQRRLDPALSAPQALRQALAPVRSNDVVVFWLGQDDVRALGEIKPVAAQHYFSGRLAGAEKAPLAAAWRARSALVYPYELPQLRTRNLEYFHIWLNLAKIPLVDEVMQSEVFFSMNFLTDTLSEMLDNLYRDYLIERAETNLSIREGWKAAQETRDRVFLGREGDMTLRHGPETVDPKARIKIANADHTHWSQGTTLYRNLSLGPGQRFASKGAYLVRFAQPQGEALELSADWTLP